MNHEKQEAIKATALCCQICAVIWQVVIALVVCIGKFNYSTWLTGPIQEALSGQNAVADNLIKSWNTNPFSDIVVVDIDSNNPDNTECPLTHPHDVIYSIWPGTRHMCDCLERADDRQYFLDIIC